MDGDGDGGQRVWVVIVLSGCVVVQRKQAETQRHFAAHNALAAAHKLCIKEMSLLDSIQSQVRMRGGGEEGTRC